MLCSGTNRSTISLGNLRPQSNWNPEFGSNSFLNMILVAGSSLQALDLGNRALCLREPMPLSPCSKSPDSAWDHQGDVPRAWLWASYAPLSSAALRTTLLHSTGRDRRSLWNHGVDSSKGKKGQCMWGSGDRKIVERPILTWLHW